MRRTIPMAIVGVAALVGLAGCASAGDPGETSAPPAPESSAAETPSPSPSEDATSTATPPPTGQIPEAPSRITDEAILGSYDAVEVSGDGPIVAWAGPGHTLIHVIGAGSGTEACQPTGESIEIDDGQLEIEFEFEESDGLTACTADLRIFGWAFPVQPAGSADITVANIDGWTQDDEDDDSDITVDIRPATEAH